MHHHKNNLDDDGGEDNDYNIDGYNIDDYNIDEGEKYQMLWRQGFGAVGILKASGATQRIPTILF